MVQGRTGRRDNPGSDRLRTPVPSEDDLQQIIVVGNVELLITWAEKLGNGLALNERLTTSQVRNFFGTVRQIQAVQAEVEPQPRNNQEPARDTNRTQRLGDAPHRQLMLLKPKLAYQAQRDKENRKGEGVMRLTEVLTPAIDLVGRERNVQHFHNFVEFFEAILAYHKAAGGRES